MFKLIFSRGSILTSLKNQTVPLLKPPYLVYFVACCFIQFGCFCVCGGLALFLPDILNKLKRLRNETPLNYYVCDAVHYNSNHLEMPKNSTVINEVRSHFSLSIKIIFFTLINVVM